MNVELKVKDMEKNVWMEKLSEEEMFGKSNKESGKDLHNLLSEGIGYIY